MKRLFALFLRNLADDSHRSSTYLVWTAALVWMWIVVNTTRSVAAFHATPGLLMLNQILFANFFFVGMVCVLYGASVVTEEREEQTLGLLVMTGMSAFSILFGKGINRFLAVTILLAIQAPFVLLSVTLGGVRPIQIPAAFAAVFAFQAMALNLAMLMSTVCRRTRHASVLTFLLLVAFVLATIAAANGASFFQWLTGRPLRTGSMVEETFLFLRGQSPLIALSEILQPSYRGAVLRPQVLGNLAAALLLFGLSWALFPAFSRMSADSPSGKRKHGRRRGLRNPGRPGRHPLVWKDFQFLGGGYLSWLLKFAVLLLLGVGFHAFLASIDKNMTASERWEGVLISLFWVGLLCAALELASLCGRLFRVEVEHHTLAPIFLLPGNTVRHLWAKFLGASIGLLPYLLVSLLCLMLSEPVREGIEEIFEHAEGVIFLLIVLFEVALAAHLILLFSLRTKWGAVPISLGIVFFGFNTLSAFLFSMMDFDGDSAMAAMLLGLVVLVVLAHLRLGVRLREVAGGGDG